MPVNNFYQLLVDNKPKKVFSRRWSKRSAVALVLDAETTDQASLLMIKRADSEGDPWSGHMAFPGGRAESVDRHGLATAKREMHEEVGFNIDGAAEQQKVNGRLVGRLSDIRTTRRVIPKPMVVSPYVFVVDHKPKLTPNYEVADTVWVPFSYFQDLSNRSTMEFKHSGRTIQMPCYRYEGKVIWGMSLSMIEELLTISGIEVPAWFVK
jgi:8-oxo-dGTP pyrophosphatase MutT (NUDIX family)